MLEDIVLNVVDLMINSLEAKLEERIMNTLISFVGKAMQPSFGYWDEQIVIAILAFLQWLSYFIFSCSMLVLIADIAEENSSLRSGQFKTIEWPTIFINVLKAIAFIEIAPIAGRLSLELGGRLLWRMDVSGMLQGAVDISRIGWAMLAMTIAVIIFVLLGSIKFGQMLIQVLTVPFYIPDIVRGNTKAIGASDAGNRMYLFVPIPIIYHRDNFLFGFKFRCVNRSLGRNGDRSEAARKIWHEFWLHRIGFQRGTDRCKCGAAVGIKVIKK